jgi:hypothetical protein
MIITYCFHYDQELPINEIYLSMSSVAISNPGARVDILTDNFIPDYKFEKLDLDVRILPLQDYHIDVVKSITHCRWLNFGASLRLLLLNDEWFGKEKRLYLDCTDTRVLKYLSGLDEITNTQPLYMYGWTLL